MRSATLLLLSAAVAITVAGCGGAGAASSPPMLRLQRDDLIAVVRALQRLAGPVDAEVTASKTAWPLVANGVATGTGTSASPAVAAAADSAAAIKLPVLLDEAEAGTLTGPAAQLAGIFRSFSALAATGWKLTGADIAEIEHGSPGSARFARQNVALYIESVYDAHFELAQLGKQLLAGYRKLGGQRAFGKALTQAEVDALASTFSEATDRLHPHVGVRLGS